MQTIGVLGGIGPQATIDFELRLHAASQRLLPQRINEGYPPMVTVFLRSQPVLFDGEKPRQPLQIEPAVLEAAARLGEWADFLVSPCNTLHHFAAEIAEAAGCELLSIVDVTVAELRRRTAARVGLLGLGIPQVYVDRFRAEGIEFVTPTAEERDRIDDAILRLAEGATSESHREAVRHAVASMRAAGVATTVLGCTELPVLLAEAARAPDLVNPTELLAVAAVRRAAGC
jgi:aspartate racemase